MNENHCLICGGFISDPGAMSHRLPVVEAVAASPNSSLCLCRSAVVYGQRRSGAFPTIRANA